MIPPSEWKSGWRMKYRNRVVILRTHYTTICEWMAEYEDSPNMFVHIRYNHADECEIIDEAVLGQEQDRALDEKRNEALRKMFGGK